MRGWVGGGDELLDEHTRLQLHMWLDTRATRGSFRSSLLRFFIYSGGHVMVMGRIAAVDWRR
jgi:hypothetical protein